MADPSKVIVVWNVRGVNNPAKRNAINNIISSSGRCVVCLQETKVQDMNPAVVRQCLGPAFDVFFCVPAIGTRGGVLLAAKSACVQLTNPHTTANTVTAWVQFQDATGWWITGVYGPQEDNEKVAFIHELKDVRDLHAGTWMIAGDFNLIADPSDKSNDRINR